VSQSSQTNSGTKSRDATNSEPELETSLTTSQTGIQQ